MTLGEFVLRAIETAPRGDQLPPNPWVIYRATRKLVGLHFWTTRPTPYYTREFYMRRGRQVPENVATE